MKHTHRTQDVRSDHELAAMSVLLIFNGEEPTPRVIENWEAKFRGNPEFEKALRRAADIVRGIAPDFKAEPHKCAGQLCDNDGQYDVSIVEAKPDASWQDREEWAWTKNPEAWVWCIQCQQVAQMKDLGVDKSTKIRCLCPFTEKPSPAHVMVPWEETRSNNPVQTHHWPEGTGTLKKGQKWRLDLERAK